MSHLAELKTEIRDLDVARAALAALGVPAAEGVTSVRSFYRVNGQHEHPVALAVGTPTAGWEGYLLGFALQPDGTYSLVGDHWGIACGGSRNTLLALGPGYDRYETVSGVGHVPTGQPVTFLAEYAMQTGLKIAAEQHMHAERLPADPAVDEAEGEKLVLTGGYLPPHMSMTLIACADGSCRVRFDGATDATCYLYTKPLEDALGQLALDASTLGSLATAHTAAREHIAR